MTPILPTISAVCAALLGLLAALLVVRVILNRVRLQVNAGDGGHAVLAQAIRAHSNLSEHVPLALLLGPTPARQAGAGLTVLVTVAAALLIPYRSATLL
jgi:uncharacterized membrane protein YecN with MAPEG domain